MRVSISLCTAMLLAIGATGASAMDANEIFNRLKAQADATGTVQGDPSAVTRGLAVSYGDPEPATEAAAKPSVVAVPAARTPEPAILAAPARPAPAEPSTYASSVDPVSAPERLPEPSYTIQSPAPEPQYTSVDAPASVTVSAPAVTSFQPAEPSAQIATYAPAATPRATPVAVQPDAASYSEVAEDKRVDLRIYFEWNSASLKSEAIGQLAELCSAIRRVGASPDNRFKIIGHTDKSGSDDYNLYLSNARAREVKRHLVEECSLPAAALLAVGEGERQSSPSTPSNAPEERRVEIQFVS